WAGACQVLRGGGIDAKPAVVPASAGAHVAGGNGLSRGAGRARDDPSVGAPRSLAGAGPRPGAAGRAAVLHPCLAAARAGTLYRACAGAPGGPLLDLQSRGMPAWRASQRRPGERTAME